MSNNLVKLQKSKSDFGWDFFGFSELFVLFLDGYTILRSVHKRDVIVPPPPYVPPQM